MSLIKDKNKNKLPNSIAQSFAPRQFINLQEDEDETTTSKTPDFNEDDFECNNELTSFRKQYLAEVNARSILLSRSRLQDSEVDSDEEPDKQGGGNDDSDLEKYSKKLKEKCLIDSEQEYSEDEPETMDMVGGLQDFSEVEQDSDYDSSWSEDEDAGSQNENEDQNTIQRKESNVASQNCFEVRNQSQKMLKAKNKLSDSAKLNELCENSSELLTPATETNANVENFLNKMVEVEKVIEEREATDWMNLTKKRKLLTTANDEEPSPKRFANAIQETMILTRRADGESVLLAKSNLVEKPQAVKDTDGDEAGKSGVYDSQNNKMSTSKSTEMKKHELQKFKQKRKKKVGTRALKGRKTRYSVNNKCVNVMIPNPHGDWTDESKTELSRYLFRT